MLRFLVTSATKRHDTCKKKIKRKQKSPKQEDMPLWKGPKDHVSWEERVGWPRLREKNNLDPGRYTNVNAWSRIRETK